MSLIGWIITGLLAGAIARLLTPGSGPGGCFFTILLGIAGAVFAGLVGRELGLYADGETASFIASTLGAIALLLIYRQLIRR